MTDSRINTNSSDGALDVGATTDELFGEIEGESPDGDAVDGGVADDEAEASDSEIEDQTAAAVFGQLQATVSDTDDIDSVLDDESPEEIIASADEPDPAPESVDGDLLVDENALEDLLLTDRTKEKEFLWIDADGDDATEAESDTREPADPAGVFVDSDRSDNDAAATDAATTVADEPEATDSSAHVPFQNTDAGETDTTEETAIVSKTEADLPATTDDDERSSGLLGWLRSKFGGLF